MAYSPNMKKYAVANSDKVISLFDSNFKKMDKITTKGAKKGDKNYIIRAIAFSPDSTILAVAQSDKIIYSIRIGLEWKERKSICSKIATHSPPTCLVWPKEKLFDLYFGTVDGKLKIGSIKHHKCSTLYSTGSYPVALNCGKGGKYLVSGHLDGSIYLYNMETQTYRKLVTCPTVPYALCSARHVVFAGNDGKVTMIGHGGNVVQKFDYSERKDLRDFTGAYANNVGETVVLLNYSQFVVFNYNSKRQEWEEKGFFKIGNYYSITAACWKPDGTKFFTGNLTGSVDVFDISIKKLRFKGKLELNYVSRSKIKVVSLEKGGETVVDSKRGMEILKVDILKDKYVLAETTETIILADLQTGKTAEVEWLGSGNERYEFSSRNICWIANAGEVSVIEFGTDEIVGTFRTEYVSTKLISAVVKNVKNEDKSRKFIAYLLDLQTICILNLKSRLTEATIEHDTRITSLSFNTNATKLLFKDQKKALYIYNIVNSEKQTLLTFCNFYKWVPDSDVIVAQSKGSLNVWYSSDSPDKKKQIPVKGSAIGIKTGEKTSVTVLENHTQMQIDLDDLLIKFGFALENKQLSQCISILEQKGGNENQGHWRTLLQIALEEQKFFIVERCYAALGNVAKARYIRKINKIVRRIMAEGKTIEKAMKNYEVQALLAMMNRQFSRAEALYLEKDEVDKAIGLYQEIHKWEDSLRIAEKLRTDDYEKLKENYFQWLLDTGQEEKAAEIKEKEGNHVQAIKLYLRAGLPVRSACLVLQYNLSEDDELVGKVLAKLKQLQCFEKMGEVYEQFGDHSKALNFYQKGENFQKAINLAKKFSPELVTKLHEKWGDFLHSQNQKESAINHFIEAGCSKKAIEAAISCHQWTKAISLLSSFPQGQSEKFCIKIAEKLRESKQFELAEKYYIKGNQFQKAFEMYITNGKLREAARFSKENFEKTRRQELYVQFAQKYQKEKNYEQSEKLYIEVGKPELAIKMYKQLNDWDKMLKLFAQYRPENLKEAHLLIGRKLEEQEDLQKAEIHYIEGGKWTTAIDMYEKRNMFIDCIRICKNYASDRDTVEIAKKWDGKISEQELINILKKMYLTDSLVDYLCEKKKFDQAFKIAEGARHKQIDVHLSYAMYLEDEKRYKEAEKSYVLAGKFDQAVNMYMDIKDFHAALTIARQYDQTLIDEIYKQQGNHCLQNGDFEKMEISFINSRKPELAINAYIKAQKYSDALRVAKKHRPDLVREISAGLDQTGDIKEMSGDQLLHQARIWEDNRDWTRAIDCYLEITSSHFQNQFELKQIWEKAINLSYNFLKSRYTEVVRIVCKRFRDLGSFDVAGEYYENIGQFEEAAKCFIKVNNFERAKNCIMNIKNEAKEKELHDLFEVQFKNYLKQKGDAEKLVGNEEIKDGLELMIKRGDWVQTLSIAKSKGPDLYNHYLKRFLQESMTAGKFKEAIQTLSKFGMLNVEQNYELYQKLINEVFSICEISEVNSLKELLKSFLKNYEQNLPKQFQEKLQKSLFLSHLLSLKDVYIKHDIHELSELVHLSLLRYLQQLSIDRPFFEAGMILKNNGKDVQGFMFLNKYLDIYDVIEDPDNNDFDDNENFKITDFGNFSSFTLPQQNFITENERLEIRDWLLQITVKKSAELKLKTRVCGSCSQDIFFNNISCPFCEYKYGICYLTGSPLEQGSSSECKTCRVEFNMSALKLYSSNFAHCPWCSNSL